MTQPNRLYPAQWDEARAQMLAEAKQCQRTWGMGFPVLSTKLLAPYLDALQADHQQLRSAVGLVVDAIVTWAGLDSPAELQAWVESWTQENDPTHDAAALRAAFETLLGKDSAP